MSGFVKFLDLPQLYFVKKSLKKKTEILNSKYDISFSDILITADETDLGKSIKFLEITVSFEVND